MSNRIRRNIAWAVVTKGISANFARILNRTTALALACLLVLVCLQADASSHKSTSRKSKVSKSQSKGHGASRASSSSTTTSSSSRKRSKASRATSSRSRGRSAASSRRSASGSRRTRASSRNANRRVISRHANSRHSNARHAASRATNSWHAVNHAQQAVNNDGPPDMGIGPRVRNYSLMTRSYALYDQGVNERLRGNYGSATDKLAESVNLLDQARSNNRDGGASTLEAMVFFELAQAAEADGDVILARDSYAHCLRAKPQYVEGYLRIVSLLATQGQLPLAMNWLKEGLKACPHDQRLNDLSTVLSSYMGGYKPALERDPVPVTKPVGPEALPSDNNSDPEMVPQTDPEPVPQLTPQATPEPAEIK